MRFLSLQISLSAMVIVAASVALADPVQIRITIRDHRFIPAEIHLPANQPALLLVTNADNLPEEFDSPDLKIEKVIAAGQTGMIRVRSLKPGRYLFSGEYHAQTAQGVVISQ